MILVDTNILLDLVTDDPNFAEWSIAELEAASLIGPLIINDVIYTELSVRYDAKEDLDTFIIESGLKHEPVPNSALFLAGKVFQKYRKSCGVRTGVLPDFFIGAHAAVLELPLLTRDTGRYRTYFPTVDLVAPENRKPT